MRVTYPMNFFADKYKPCSNISRAASGRGLTVNTYILRAAVVSSITCEYKCPYRDDQYQASRYDHYINTSNVTAKLFYNRQVYIAMIAEDIR